MALEAEKPFAVRPALCADKKSGKRHGKNLGKPPLCLANALARLFARRD